MSGRVDFEQWRRDARDTLSPPAADPVGQLRHVLSAYVDSDDSHVALRATAGIYNPRIDGVVESPTGVAETFLTFGDLRALLVMVDPSSRPVLRESDGDVEPPEYVAPDYDGELALWRRYGGAHTDKAIEYRSRLAPGEDQEYRDQLWDRLTSGVPLYVREDGGEK